MYKVVTENNKSLGLRKNPNVMKFPVGKWVNDPNPIEGKQDVGGIWCCEKLSSARTLKKYYENRYGKARIYVSEIDKVLFQNSYRTKTNRIKLIKEIL